MAEQKLWYEMKAPKGANWSGIAKVQVYTTEHSYKDMFLHVVKFPDGKVDFIIAPQDFRL